MTVYTVRFETVICGVLLYFITLSKLYFARVCPYLWYFMNAVIRRTWL